MIAYLSNEFPAEVEPYVLDEVEELQRHGLNVLVSSIKRPIGQQNFSKCSAEILYFFPLKLLHGLQAFLLLLHPVLINIYVRIFFQGKENLSLRFRAFVHTWLGAYYAALLKNKKNVEHIHVHYGYFGAWVAMVAARLVGIPYSMTLHGSDLLVHAVYLDIKLRNCKNCFTISNFNRNYILSHYPEILADKVVVSRMGVDVPAPAPSLSSSAEPLRLLAIGRLHPIKDHAFLVRACRVLKEQRCRFTCVIIGEGPERAALEKLIEELDLSNEIALAGHVAHRKLPHFYDSSDLVVLTSRSEGIPIVLMEAMAHKKIVLAPAITGIHELVIPGKTGFLYSPGSMDDFIRFVLEIKRCIPDIEPIRQSARDHVNRSFNREKNLAAFAELFMEQLQECEEAHDANPVLQQI